MPLGECVERWPGAVLLREQPFERSWIGACHVEYLHPASRPCHQRDRAAANSERRSHRSQRSRSCLPVCGRLPDPDHQGPIVLSADFGTGRPGPDPHSNTHPASVRPGTPAGGRFWHGKEICPVIRAHCCAVSYDDRVTASPVRPVVLRDGVEVDDPLTVVLGLLKAPGPFDVSDPARPASFGEPDLKLANRGGARISAAQIAAILQRRGPIERALADIPPGASLSGEVNSVPWLPLRQLFEGFAGIWGVGMSKMTKALYPKRPALIPMLDSLVQAYLRDDDLGAQAPFAERALGLVRGYQRDLHRNQPAVQAVRQDLTGRGYRLTEVRILDLLILSAQATA
jgi:Family of unknown function (DUF6308)